MKAVLQRNKPSGQRHRTAAAMASLALVALAGCGAASASAATTGKVPLVLYAAEGYDAATCQAFQQYSGIQCELTDDSTGPLDQKVQAEINHPTWGVLWTDGDEAFAALDQEHYLLRGFEPNVTLTAAAQQATPSDKSYIITGFTAMPAVVYQANVVSDPPTSWQDLLSPKWDGEVGMNNPSISGPTYPFVAGMMQQLGGVSQGEQFFSQLKANGLHIYDTNKPTLAALEAGQIKLALVQNSAAIGAELADGALDLKEAYLPKVTMLPSVIGIDGKASAQEISEAKAFVNFVFSGAGQSVRLGGDPEGDSLFWPSVSAYTQLPAVPAFSSIPYQILPAATWGVQESTLNTWFTNNVVQ